MSISLGKTLFKICEVSLQSRPVGYNTLAAALSHNLEGFGGKKECRWGAESQESRAAASCDLQAGSSVTAWRPSAPRHWCLQPCACAFLGVCSRFEL